MPRALHTVRFSSPHPEPWPIQPCLQQAINVMEACHHHAECRPAEFAPAWMLWPQGSRLSVQRDLAKASRPSGARANLETLVDVARECAIHRGVPTAWYGRRYHPVTTALLLLCAESGVPWQRVMKGQLEDPDFPRLTAAAGRVAGSPLVLCDSRNTLALGTSLDALAARGTLRLAICDWRPSRDQRRAFAEASSRHPLRVISA